MRIADEPLISLDGRPAEIARMSGFAAAETLDGASRLRRHRVRRDVVSQVSVEQRPAA